VLRRQEVTPVLTYINRPSALPAAHTQGFTCLGAPDTAAHRWVGSPVVSTATPGVEQTQTPRIRIQGISVFAVENSVAVMDPVNGVRGKPPRGRPV
jgi:hypothetical protein